MGGGFAVISGIFALHLVWWRSELPYDAVLHSGPPEPAIFYREGSEAGSAFREELGWLGLTD